MFNDLYTVIEIPFLKKFNLSSWLPLGAFKQKPSRIAGVDIGTYSTKVVQLRYEKERGILETYGELLNRGYSTGGGNSGLLHHSDSEIAALLKDLFQESRITARDAVFAVPASLSFVTTISLPPVPEKELREAIPYEARRYIPIPISEVVLDWEVLGRDEAREKIEILLVAVPQEVIEKYKRVCEALHLTLQAVEVETFSMVRSLGGTDLTPTAFINFGHHATALALADRGKVRMSHSFVRGSWELTRALERGLNISSERAEAMKRETGISERIEEKEITSTIVPLIETLFSEIERFISIYNRKAPRTIQKINLTGGGANLKGLIEYAVAKFGVEVTKSSPFIHIVSPAFMQPILREIGPSFSIAVGLAMHGITRQ